MSPLNLSADDLKKMKEKRLEFLRSCCKEFKKTAIKRINKATNSYEPVECADDWLVYIINRYFENVDHIRRELLDQTHLIDKHKVASGLLYYIMRTRPIFYTNKTLNQNDEERGRLNARFALYVVVEFIHRWYTADNRIFSVTSGGKAFVKENIKWLGGASIVPLQLMAQAIYLLERVCVLEDEHIKYSCVTNCSIRQPKPS